MQQHSNNKPQWQVIIYQRTILFRAEKGNEYIINTRIAIIHEKEIAAFGMPDDVLSEENIRRVFNVDAKVLSYSQIDKRYNYILPMVS